MRCSGCGNEMPAWANGVCYTCGRIQQESKRFGVHSSARRRARQTWTGPALESLGAGDGGNFTLPPWLAQAVTPALPEHCPVCGQDVPQDQLEEHLQLHKRLSSARSRRNRSPKQPPHLSHDRAGIKPRELNAAGERPEEAPQQIRRRGINRLLADIYGKPWRLSDILCGGGISQTNITYIYEEKLTDFLEVLLGLWRVAFAGELITGGWHILTRSYGLDGVTPDADKDLAQALGLSESGVTQTRQLVLRVLRAPASRRCLEELTVTVARQKSQAA
jgi:hypothetical protein